MPTARRRHLVLVGLVAVTVALGILGMHSLVTPGHTGPMVAPSAVAATVAVSAADVPAADLTPPGDGHGAPAGGHSLLSMCLAVLGRLGLVLLVALALLRPSGPAAPIGTIRSRAPAPGASRPPPLRPPSLSQLCLLRV